MVDIVDSVTAIADCVIDVDDVVLDIVDVADSMARHTRSKNEQINLIMLEFALFFSNRRYQNLH